MKKCITVIVATALIMTASIIAATDYDRARYSTAVISLEEGDTGAEVAELQAALMTRGYLDAREYTQGLFDGSTEDAVKEFQIDHELLGTGIATYNLLMKLGIGHLYTTGSSYAAATQSAEKLLAMAINGEARGEPYEGQVAVGAVILNRVRSSSFPNTIAGVVYQPYAFSSVNDGQIYYSITEGSTVLKAARDALNGWDPTYGSLYFWNPETATSKWIWSRQVTRVIGKHYFGL